MELFAEIRRDARVEELSVRGLARRHGVHRRTVRQALSAAVPPPRKRPVRCSPRLEPFEDVIDAMLRADLDAPRKQRHTATRVLSRLVEEHDAAGLSYSTVRDYVRVRRAEIDVEGGRRVEAFIAQDHARGRRARSTTGRCGWSLAGSARIATCSCCGSRTRGSRSTGCTRPKRRRRSCRGTSGRSRRSVGSPPATSSTTT